MDIQERPAPGTEDMCPSDSMARVFPAEHAALKANERLPSALAHLLSLPPIWGVLFAAGIIHYFRASSRAVTFQARQAIVLHLLFLGAGLAGIGARLAARLLDTAFPGRGFDLVEYGLGLSKGVAMYILFASVVIGAATLCSFGWSVTYPWIGARLWNASRRVPDDELYG